MFRFTLSLVHTIILLSCNETKNNSDLVGIWEIHCHHDEYGCFKDAIYSMEFFGNGEGIAYIYDNDTSGFSYPYKWQADTNHLQIIMERVSGKPDTNDYELIYFKEENRAKIAKALDLPKWPADYYYRFTDKMKLEGFGVRNDEVEEINLPSKDILFRTKLDICDTIYSAFLDTGYVCKTYAKMRGTMNPATKTKSTFTDARDGKEYKTVKIGEQTWMAENLQFNIDGSECYGENGKEVFLGRDKHDRNIYKILTTEEVQALCEKHGREYTWEAAKKACPKGWHLPNNKEWDKLYRYVSLTTTDSTGTKYTYAAVFLKSISGWSWRYELEDYAGHGNGMDRFGFSALSYPGYPRQVAWWSASKGVAPEDSIALKPCFYYNPGSMERLAKANPNYTRILNYYIMEDLCLESYEREDNEKESTRHIRCVRD